MKTERRGFTIVELVIVIAVVAVLAAVLIPTFSDIVEKANISSDIQLTRSINVILQAETVGASAPATIDEFKELLDKNGISPTELKTPKYTIYWLKEEGIAVLANNKNEAVYPEEYAGEHYNEAKWTKCVGGGYQELVSHQVTTRVNGTVQNAYSPSVWHGKTYSSGHYLDAGSEHIFASITATMSGEPIDCTLEYEGENKVKISIENVIGDIELTITTAPKSP